VKAAEANRTIKPKVASANTPETANRSSLVTYVASVDRGPGKRDPSILTKDRQPVKRGIFGKLYLMHACRLHESLNKLPTSRHGACDCMKALTRTSANWRTLDMRKPITVLLAGVSSMLIIFGTAGIGTAKNTRHHSDNDNPPPIPATFSAANFSGNYADSFSGPIVTPTSVVGALAGNGVLTADGKGNITAGTETVSDGTNACEGTLAGAYVINPDGTGTLTTTFTTTATLMGTCTKTVTTHSALVLRNSANISTSQIDAGLLVSGHLTHQPLVRPPTNPGNGNGNDD
jgi:hypothetical protein